MNGRIVDVIACQYRATGKLLYRMVGLRCILSDLRPWKKQLDRATEIARSRKNDSSNWLGWHFSLWKMKEIRTKNSYRNARTTDSFTKDDPGVPLTKQYRYHLKLWINCESYSSNFSKLKLKKIKWTRNFILWLFSSKLCNSNIFSLLIIMERNVGKTSQRTTIFQNSQNFLLRQTLNHCDSCRTKAVSFY